MATYCITFRIENVTVGGKTYDDRRQSLIDSAHKGNEGYWEETTSFILAGSSLSTSAFAKKICGGLSAQHDLVFVFDPADMSAVYFGPLKHEAVLRSFFPLVKKLP